MNAEDIYKVIEQAVEKTVPPTVEKVVNGKINLLQATLDAHMELSRSHRERQDAYIKNLEPLIEGLKFLNTGRTFLIWFKPLMPLLIIGGAIWLAIKRSISGI